MTCTGWVEQAQSHPTSNAKASLPSLRQLLAGDHDLHGLPCSCHGGRTPPHPLTRHRLCLMPDAHSHKDSHKDGHGSLGEVSGWARVGGPEGIQAMVSGKCWQVLHSRRNRGPQDGESLPGPSPSQGQTSSRGGRAGNRHNLRRKEGQAWARGCWASHLLSGCAKGWAQAEVQVGRPWPLLSSLKPAGLQNLFSLGGALQPDRWGCFGGPVPTCQESKSHSPRWPSLHITPLLHPPARYIWVS